MKLIIEPAVLRLLPELKLFGLIVEGANNSGTHQLVGERLQACVRSTESDIKSRELSDIPEVKAWRAAYRSFGAHKDYRCSLESLLRRVRSKGELPLINSLVDIGNLCSVRFKVPCGVEKIAGIVGDIRLAVAEGSESFVQLGSVTDEPPVKGEVVYVDDVGVICRNMNWRESDRVRVDESTSRALVIFEALDDSKVPDLEGAVELYAELLQETTGGALQRFRLSKEQSEVTINLTLQ
jgi:DNA/RNA-binding domain of Phe-tRNA-synthetase-like protein